jgi:hypothetical protein
LRAAGVAVALLAPAWGVATVLWAELAPEAPSQARLAGEATDGVVEPPSPVERLVWAAPRAAAWVIGGACALGALGAAAARSGRGAPAGGGAGEGAPWPVRVREEAIDEADAGRATAWGAPWRGAVGAVGWWAVGWLFVHSVAWWSAGNAGAWWAAWSVSLRRIELWALSGGWAVVATAAWSAWARGRRGRAEATRAGAPRSAG